MPDSLFERFLRIENLRRAWHLAYHDSREAFLPDALGHEDFAAQLDPYLRDLQRRLRLGSYEPRPLLRIDVPKSSLAVRPGATPEIEDSIVMFAIMLQIAPPLDRRMSDGVYAYRVSSRRPSRAIFEHRDLAFLRRRTRRQVAAFKEWYQVWPSFEAEAIDSYEAQGFRYLSVSDIAAYYENISHPILRDILFGYLPSQQRILNLTMRVLHAWGWPTRAGVLIPRGIPQGPDFSGFLANVYLMPLDKALEIYGRNHPIKYIRYVDDVKIFTKSEEDARAVLIEMNHALRQLQLNIQGSKTVIHRGTEIPAELVDPEFGKIESLTHSVTKHASKVTPAFRRRTEKRAKKLLSLIAAKKPFSKRESKKLRRLLTALNLVKSPLAIRFCLKAVESDPEHRLNEKVAKYLASFPKHSTISSHVLSLVASKTTRYYPSQQTQLLEVVRLNGCNASTFNKHARSVLASRAHWHVKQEVLRALCCIGTEAQTLREVWNVFKRGESADTRRSALLCLICTNAHHPLRFLSLLQTEIDAKVLRTVRYLSGLAQDVGLIRRELNSMSRLQDDRFMIDKLYKWPLIAQTNSQEVRAEARKILIEWLKTARRSHLKATLKRFLQLF
jgi:hypothetical protein